MSGGGRGGGRGGRGGRGRGGGRGRSGGRGRRNAGNRSGGRRQDKGGAQENAEENKTLNIEDNPKEFFSGTATAKQHYEAQEQNCGRYCAAFAVLARNGIKIAQNAKIRALAIALGRNDAKTASAFLQTKSQFGLVEVLKALTLLDAGRQVRILEKKLRSWELSATKVRPQKLGNLRRDINNMKKNILPVGSASGAVCNRITKWVRGFSEEDLEFYAIHFPKEPWMKLADICHFNPKDFPSAPWFLPHCFGSGELPAGSIVKVCADLTEETVNEAVKGHDISFSILKKFSKALNTESKKRIATYEPKIDTVLWYYEDLRCDEVDQIIYRRLSQGDPVTLSNGKLLERLLTFTRLISGNELEYINEMDQQDNFLTRLIDVAEVKLTSIRLPLESPVAILGDASPSMNVAIRTSTIIASLLTSICSAKLVFFDSENRDAPFLPKTVKEMLKLAFTINTTGATSPAASLYPFYERKEAIKTFIVVTDEEENRDCNGYRFAPLFQKYHEEVYPADLVFISFLHSQFSKGQMVTALKGKGFNPKQLVFDRERPDLSKLDSLFGQLSATASFNEELIGAEQTYKELGVERLLATVKGGHQLGQEETE